MENQIISRRKANGVLALVAFTCLLICSSCRHNEVYYRFGQVSNAEWYRDSVFMFVVDSSSIDVDTLYDIDLEITSNTSYPYQNIWYTVLHNLDSDSVITEKQSQYFLTDEGGVWLGDGFGSLYHISVPFKQGIRFPEKRDYTFRISQAMRDEPLVGIEKVGMKVSKSL